MNPEPLVIQNSRYANRSTINIPLHPDTDRPTLLAALDKMTTEDISFFGGDDYLIVTGLSNFPVLKDKIRFAIEMNNLMLDSK